MKSHSSIVDCLQVTSMIKQYTTCIMKLRDQHLMRKRYSSLWTRKNILELRPYWPPGPLLMPDDATRLPLRCAGPAMCSRTSWTRNSGIGECYFMRPARFSVDAQHAYAHTEQVRGSTPSLDTCISTGLSPRGIGSGFWFLRVQI